MGAATTVARQLLRLNVMRAFVAVFIIAGLGVLYLWQKKNDPAPAVQTVTTAQSHPVSPATASTSTRQVSEHNWMKRSLDRARDVTQEARARTQENQNP